MILNETPIRTSKNYGINNIDIDDFSIPEIQETFEELNISGDVDEFTIKKEKNKIDLKYGNGEVLLKQIKNYSNVNFHIIVEGKKNKELQLEFDLTNKNQNLVDNILIEARENSNGIIIIKYLSSKNDKCYHNGLIKVLAQKKSNLNIIFVNMLNNKTENFTSIENILENDSKVKYNIIDFGGKNSITNYYTNLKGENSSNEVKTIYLGTSEQTLDLNYIVEVYGKNSIINMDVKGAIKDKSKKHFKGTIDFKKGSKKSKGNENEFCTILSDRAKSISLPMLLCTEEDVEGNHGTASRKT